MLLLSASSCLQGEVGGWGPPPPPVVAAPQLCRRLLTLVNPESPVPSSSPAPPCLPPERAAQDSHSSSPPRPGERFPNIPLRSGFWGASRVISDPSLSSPAVELFPWTTSPHTENIVIREEVTGTWGESQTFPVREAASGIEHTQPGGNLEGWTSRPQGGVTRGSSAEDVF